MKIAVCQFNYYFRIRCLFSGFRTYLTSWTVPDRVWRYCHTEFQRCGWLFSVWPWHAWKRKHTSFAMAAKNHWPFELLDDSRLYSQLFCRINDAIFKRHVFSTQLWQHVVSTRLCSAVKLFPH